MGAGQRGVPVGCVQIGECWQIGWGMRPGCLLGIKGVVGRGVGWMWLGQLGSFGWYVPRWVLVNVTGALVSSLSLSPLTPTWFPTNVACNSHVNLLNIEVGSLESQRLWRLMKTGRGKLRATFLGECRMCGLSLNLVPSR